jgi:hypothetical protein
VRRLLVTAIACAAPAALLAIAACVAGGKVPVNLQPDADATAAGNDGAVDGTEPDAVEELTVGDACGDAPYVTLGIYVVGLELDNLDGAPLQGAAFTSPLCPSLVKYSDEGGNISRPRTTSPSWPRKRSSTPTAPATRST